MPAGEFSDTSKKQLARLKADPRLYMQRAWRHPNRQDDNYDFKTTDGEKTLDYLLADSGPLNPYEWGDVNLLIWGRGCLKSTTLLGIVSWALQFYGPHGWTGYMTAPRRGQVKEFVGKLKDIVGDVGLKQYREKNSYGEQKFEFARGDGTSVTSSFKTNTGWGEGDSLRAPHTHFGLIDEFQDLDKAAFDTFFPAIDRELPSVPFFPTIFGIGTPKMENTFFHDMWEMSDKREWKPDEGVWEPQSDSAQIGEGDDARTIRAWHLPQQKCPIHTEGDIEQARRTLDKQKFENEIRARFYTPEDDLLTEDDVRAIEDPSMSFTRQRRFEDSYVTIGVDWGGGEDRKAADTVVVVGEHIDYGERASPKNDLDDVGVMTELRHVEFLEQSKSKDDEFEDIEQLILRYDADNVIVDEGYASKRREDLQRGNHTMDPDGYPDLVTGCRFGNVSDADKAKWKDPERKALATVDKTHMVKGLVDSIKSENIVIPASDLSFEQDHNKGTKIRNQLTAAHEQKKEGSSGRKDTTITAPSGRNDDLLDAMTYMWLGYHDDVIGKTETVTKFGSHTRSGY